MSTCDRCGALLGDSTKHDEWHAEVAGISATADDALERADDAQNTLYQNNIQV